jgi:parallel beta-helix repeat protein
MLFSPRKASIVSFIVLLFMLFSVSQVCWAQAPEAFSLIIIGEDGTINCANLPDLSVIPIQRQGEVYTLTGNINSGPGISIGRSGITIDGAGFILQGMTGEMKNSASGLSFATNVGEVTVKNLKITNFATGVSLNDNSGNVFVGNDVSNNVYNGFYLSGTCCNNTINGNTISNNPRWGFILLGREPPYGGPSTGNKIIGNTIENNGWEKSTIPSYGMEDDYGAGVWLWEATNNTFYGNKFVNNAQQAFLFDHAKNVWSAGLPSGGNYWSDYSGVDADDDGIGDSPYVIDTANSDPYPLIAQSLTSSPSEEAEIEQQTQIPVEYIIALVAVVIIIVLLALVYRKRKHPKVIQ